MMRVLLVISKNHRTEPLVKLCQFKIEGTEKLINIMMW